MLNLLYTLFILIILGYFILSKRKEVPLIVVLHAFFQYVLTLAFWIFNMNGAMAGLLLGFMTISTVLLVWGRYLNYSRELLSIQLFFSISQWAIIGSVLVFMAVKSPYYYLIPSSTLHSHINAHQLSIHPVIKLCGNILLFTTFFHLILNWGQKWSIRKSLVDLGPFLIYLVLAAMLRFFQSFTSAFPIS